MKSVIPAAFRNWKKGRCGWHRCRRRVKTEPNIGSNGSPGTGEDAAAIDIPIPCGQADLSDIGRRRRCRPRPIPRDNRILSRWRERFDSARERHHVPTTFKAYGDHFQSLREPSSQPRFHPLHGPAIGSQCVRIRDRKMDMAAIAITTCVALYLALRLTLRVYFPPDT